jgi:hypothetical protein
VQRKTFRTRCAAGIVATLSVGMLLVGPAARAGTPPAELWHKTLTNEQENGVAFDSNGNVYVAATFYGSPKVARLHSYDKDGNLNWTKDYKPKDAQGSNGYDVAVAPDDSIYLLAYSYIPAKKYFELSVVRYSAAGKVLWAKNQPNINAYAIAASKKAVVAVGNVGATKTAGKDAWVRSYTPKGVVNWTRTIDAGAKKDDVAQDATIASDGTVYAVGYATLHAAKPHDQDAALWHLSASGKLLGSSYKAGTVAGGYDTWTGITRAGTKFFVGGDVNDTSGSSSPRQALVTGTKLSAVTTLNWGSGYTTIWGVASAGSKLFATGTSNEGVTGDDAKLVEMDATGGELWSVTVDTGTSEYGFGVGSDGTNVAMVGGTNSDGFIYVYPV